MLLQIDKMTKRFGPVMALRDISAEVGPGAVGLMGPNGAGKSTLIRALLGLLNFEAGSARVLGFDVRSELWKIRRDIGYMPEHETLFPQMTGLGMVSFGGELAGLAREDAVARAHEMLDYVGVGEARYRRVETFSTGMKQRVKLAQALVHGPRLLFLDEPTNGLDPLGREEMLAMIAEIARAGVSVVLSSHLLRDVERVCDSVLLMDEGQIVHYGDMTAFKAGEPDRIEVEVRGPGGGEGFIQLLEDHGLRTEASRNPDRLMVHLDGPLTVDRIWQVAVTSDYEVRHLKPVEVSLEHAFLAFMQQVGADRAAGRRPRADRPSENGGENS